MIAALLAKPAVATAWGVFRRVWWMLPIASLALALFITRGTLADAKADLEAEKTAHLGTIANYRSAAHEAARKDAENVLRVKGEQAKITEDVSHDYQIALADLRARYDRLRAAPRANTGSSGATGLPTIPSSTSGLDGGTDQAGFSAQDAFIASAQALQLQALQAWVKAQSSVSVGNE